MKKILKFLFIIQEFDNRGAQNYKGKGYQKAYRLNPYNPLSYVAIPIIFLIAIVLYGVVGFNKEVDLSNPFRWN